jgi:hypothetical protein
VHLLREKTAFLLDLPLRISDLQHLHGGKPLGVYLQRCKLAMPGLRRVEAVLGISKQQPVISEQ